MCDNINKGRAAGCPNAISGLLNVYFVPYGTGGFTYDATTEEITGTSEATPPPAYKYELHLGNDLTQNIMAAPENGTLYFEQALNLTLKKLSQSDNVEVKKLASTRPHIFVEDQMGNIMLVGRINGANVTGGTAVTGNDFGDLNGYTLTFTGKERDLANFYVEPATPGDPSPFFTDFAVAEIV